MFPAVMSPVVWPMTIGMWPHRSRQVRSAIDAAAKAPPFWVALTAFSPPQAVSAWPFQFGVRPVAPGQTPSSRCIRRAAKWDSNTVLTHHAKF
jgi:hypothetical protein